MGLAAIAAIGFMCAVQVEVAAFKPGDKVWARQASEQHFRACSVVKEEAYVWVSCEGQELKLDHQYVRPTTQLTEGNRLVYLGPYDNGTNVWAKPEGEQFYRRCRFGGLAEDHNRGVVYCQKEQYIVPMSLIKYNPTEVFKPGDKVLVTDETGDAHKYIFCSVIRFDKSEKYAANYLLKCNGKEYSLTEDRLAAYPAGHDPGENSVLRGLLVVIMGILLVLVPMWAFASWMEPKMIARFGNNPLTAWVWWVMCIVVGLALFGALAGVLIWTGFV